jgi:hypothetical protein
MAAAGGHSSKSVTTGSVDRGLVFGHVALAHEVRTKSGTGTTPARRQQSLPENPRGLLELGAPQDPV